MIAILGYLTLALAFLLAVYGLAASMWGLSQKSSAWIESARLALLLIFPLVTISLVVLLVLLGNQRFDVAYVYSVTSLEMPLYLRLTALWGGQSGSLLFWSWLLAGFTLFFGLRKWQQDEAEFLPWALLVVFITLVFFLMLNVFMEPPFERFWHMPDGSLAVSVLQPAGAFQLSPQDGQGLNPLLRHPGMIWHPPALYLGYVGFIIPFALAIGALARGRRDRRWIEISRPWILVTWVFLSLGLVLGMRWAYDILGWGGYWGWDPVEIAALMPWLSATGLLHTALLQRRRRGGFIRWNLVLVIVTFVLVIFGTFITRSGVISSVHSFADSDVGLPMFLYLVVLSLGSLGLLIYRWRDLQPSYEPEFGFTKETLTLFTNLVLLSILMVCLLGVVYPIFSDLLTGTQITVGPAWYKRITGPLFALLVFLVGVCPLAAWSGTNLMRLKNRLVVVLPISVLVPVLAWTVGNVRQGVVLAVLWLAGFSVLVLLADYGQQVNLAYHKADRKRMRALWAPIRRNHRRYGALLVHLGIVLLSIGIIGIEGLQQETQATLVIGESVELGGYAFRFENLDHNEAEDGRLVSEARLAITREGEEVGMLNPQREIYPKMGMAVTHPGLKGNLALDLYAILVDWQPISGDEATFRVFYNPLVSWLWIGAGVLTVGTLVALLPESLPRKRGNQIIKDLPGAKG